MESGCDGVFEDADSAMGFATACILHVAVHVHDHVHDHDHDHDHDHGRGRGRGRGRGFEMACNNSLKDGCVGCEKGCSNAPAVAVKRSRVPLCEVLQSC